MSDAAKLCQVAWRKVSETHMYRWYMQSDMFVPSNIFYYNMKKKCLMWLRRDERVEPEIIVRKFGTARSRWSGSVGLRMKKLRMDWGERKGNIP